MASSTSATPPLTSTRCLTGDTGRASTSSTGALFTIASATTMPRAMLEVSTSPNAGPSTRAPSPSLRRSGPCNASALDLEQTQLVDAHLDHVGLDRGRTLVLVRAVPD